MSEAVRSYGKFEFCKAVHCPRLLKSDTHADQFQCVVSGNHRCIKTAKQFHKWLMDAHFMILKPMEKDDE